jgi:beta-1,4-mannosyl-glycoprotein beta-1,4-N-acetylglucosaminyltransferase
MIYDSFQIFNELDLLEIRLNTHNDYVDKFIITESTVTHTGNDKPLFFLENRNLFKKFDDKIIHIIIDKKTDEENIIEETFVKDKFHQNIVQLRDTFQRMYFLKKLQFNDDDIILILDIDEMVDFRKKIDFDLNKINMLILKNYYYYLNNESSYISDGGLYSTYKILKPFVENNNFMNIRSWSKHNTDKIKCTSDTVGWHFSFMGGLDRIKYKIESWSHPEYNTPNIKEDVNKHILNNTDIFNRKDHYYKLKSLDETFPDYVLKNKNKFNSLIHET